MKSVKCGEFGVFGVFGVVGVLECEVWSGEWRVWSVKGKV